MAGTSPVRDENGDIQAHVFQIGGMDAALPGVAETEPAPVLPTSARPSSQGAERTKTTASPTRANANGPEVRLSTKQLLSQLKTRLRVVEREIKTRKALEKERDQIQRLIAAALTERDNVRRLRSAG